MIRVDSKDVDKDLTPDVLLSWIDTTWVKKPVQTSQPITVSGPMPPFERNVIKFAAEVPITQEIIDDNVRVSELFLRPFTHDQFVELKQSLNEDQLALVLLRVGNKMKEQERTISELTGQLKRVKKTARKMFKIKKTTNSEDILELLDLPIPNEW